MSSSFIQWILNTIKAQVSSVVLFWGLALCTHACSVVWGQGRGSVKPVQSTVITAAGKLMPQPQPSPAHFICGSQHSSDYFGDFIYTRTLRKNLEMFSLNCDMQPSNLLEF